MAATPGPFAPQRQGRAYPAWCRAGWLAPWRSKALASGQPRGGGSSGCLITAHFTAELTMRRLSRPAGSPPLRLIPPTLQARTQRTAEAIVSPGEGLTSPTAPGLRTPPPSGLANFSVHSPEPSRPALRHGTGKPLTCCALGLDPARRHSQRCCGPLPKGVSPGLIPGLTWGFGVAGDGFEPSKAEPTVLQASPKPALTCGYARRFPSSPAILRDSRIRSTGMPRAPRAREIAPRHRRYARIPVPAEAMPSNRTPPDTAVTTFCHGPAPGCLCSQCEPDADHHYALTRAARRERANPGSQGQDKPRRHTLAHAC